MKSDNSESVILMQSFIVVIVELELCKSNTGWNAAYIAMLKKIRT